MANAKKGFVDRRDFLRHSAAGAAALIAGPAVAAAERQTPAQRSDGRPDLVPPSERMVEDPGSDFMLDVIRALGIEYIAANPGSSFDGLHESIINYGNNQMPELLTCCHEESSVAMAHGYAKIEGKPMMALLHGTIGIQHASMAIYNAYADRVPVYMIAGLDNNGPVQAHNAVDMASMVRSYVKWDHQPLSLDQYVRSALRAYTLAMTPPMGPVLLVVDAKIQEQERTLTPKLPKLSVPSPPSADIGSVREVARLLVAAENPTISVGRMARTPNGITLLVELAELLQAAVRPGRERVNFPSRHPLAGAGAGPVDLVLYLEGDDREEVTSPSGGVPKSISISAAELLATQNYNVNGSPLHADLAIAADAEATLPSLIEEVKRLITPDRRRIFQERGVKHADANRQARLRAMEAARYGWDDSPVSLARLAAELWPLIRNEDWSLVSPQGFIGRWPGLLWDMDKFHRYIGGQGGGGMGYGAPAAVGAALANRKYGRLSINIQTDGDLNYAPGVLWTAVHHKIPLLTIMHNNRGYHQEVMYVQHQANLRNRGADRAHIGTTLRDPDIDYAKMAEAYGMYSEGPISDPKDLAQALKRGIERVKRGEPAMIDVITQPR